MASCFSGYGDRIRILEFYPRLADAGLFGVPADFILLLTTLPRTFGVIKSFSNLLTRGFAFLGLRIVVGSLSSSWHGDTTASLLSMPVTCFLRHALYIIIAA